MGEQSITSEINGKLVKTIFSYHMTAATAMPYNNAKDVSNGVQVELEMNNDSPAINKLSKPRYNIIEKGDGLYLHWLEKASRILIIHKLNDSKVMEAVERLIDWLIAEKIGIVYIEDSTYSQYAARQFTSQPIPVRLLQSFNKHSDDLTGLIDLIICLGGDGTLLYASSLFQTDIPPIMAFNLGTLGFLTPFQFDLFHESIPSVLNGEPKIFHRSRLECTMITAHNPAVTKQCLNEVVIDRASMPFLSNLDVFINDHYVTTVAGDGIIISTPTGSTAYAMAVGASMIHPNVNCMLIAPISPHSLSFRPIVLPAQNVEVRVTSRPQSSSHSRETNSSESGASVSVDGRTQCLLQTANDEVRIRISSYPVSSLCQNSEVSDWFCSLAKILHWNARSTNPNLSFCCP